jgi:hypothetical protein
MTAVRTAVQYTEELVAATSHDVTIPGTPAAGDLLLMIAHIDNNPPSIGGMPTGWVQLKRFLPNASRLCETWYKFAEGGESSFQFTTTTSQISGNECWLLTGAHTSTPPEASAGASGTSTTPDPDSLTPSWGAEDNLYVAYEGNNLEAATAFPTNYDLYQSSPAHDIGSEGFAIAARAITGSPEDPGTFTLANSRAWHAFTICIRPAPAFSAATMPQIKTNSPVMRRRSVVAY